MKLDSKKLPVKNHFDGVSQIENEILEEIKKLNRDLHLRSPFVLDKFCFVLVLWIDQWIFFLSLIIIFLFVMFSLRLNNYILFSRVAGLQR